MPDFTFHQQALQSTFAEDLSQHPSAFWDTSRYLRDRGLGAEVDLNGGLITIGKLRTFDALGPDFLGQGVFVNDFEALLHKELGLERKGKNARQAELLRFSQTALE